MGDSLSFFGIKKRINKNDFEKEEHFFGERLSHIDFSTPVFDNNTGTAGR